MKKRLFLFVITAMLSFFAVLNVSAEDDIKIVINNKELYTEIKPLIVDGRTLVPVRAIGEAMGCEVVWVAATKTVNMRNDSTIVAMQIDNKNITKVKRTTMEQKLLQTDVPPMIINDSTYIPVRAFAEALDAIVGWDQSTGTVMIVYDTTLKYAGDYVVDTYAGNGEKQKHDSTFSMMSFISPESITANKNGDLFVADSGMIRKLSNGASETVKFEPSYIRANLVRCYNNDIYILTNEFQNTDGIKYYGVVKLTDAGAEGLFITEATYSKITDMDISPDGILYVIYYNAGVGQNYLAKLELDSGSITYLCEIDAGIQTLAVDDNGNVFLGNTVKGSVYFYDTSERTLTLFAGADEKLKFVDGPNPMFFEPRRMDYKDGYLYILDYNIVRRVAVDKANRAISSETLAGKISFEQPQQVNNGKGSEAVFTASYLMDMVVTDDGVFLTDPKNAVVRLIHN